MKTRQRSDTEIDLREPAGGDRVTRDWAENTVLASRELRDLVRNRGWDQVSPAHANLRTAGFALTWVAAGVAAHRFGWPAAVLSWFVIGWLITGSISAAHEALHNNLYRRRDTNRAAGWVWAAVAGLPFETYRAYHLAHHADTNGPTDPEPKATVTSAAGHVGVFAVGGVYFWWEMWAPTVAVMFGGHGPQWVSPRARARIRANGWALVGGFAALGAAAVAGVWSTGALWSFWWGGLVVSALFSGPLIAMPEHHNTIDGPGRVADTTRTVVSGPLCRAVLWNANFHTAHHMIPSVPAHRLAELDAVIADDCRWRADSYLGWHWDQLRAAGSR